MMAAMAAMTAIGIRMRSMSASSMSERALHRAAIDAQRGAGGGRRERARDVRHHRGHFFGGREALEQRSGAHVREEFRLELVGGDAAILRERFDEIADAAGFRGSGQYA